MKAEPLVGEKPKARPLGYCHGVTSPCARCGGPTDARATYAPDGTLLCSRCAAFADVALANADIARNLEQQRQAANLVTGGAVAAAGAGVGCTVFVVIGAVVSLLLTIGVLWLFLHWPTGRAVPP